MDHLDDIRSLQSLGGKIGAHRSWARTTDRKARTKPARTAWFQRFEREVDPDGILSPAERAVRAEHALQAHMLGLALRSAQARRVRAKK